MYDLIIVGAGPSGMSAAIAASRAGLTILLLEGSDKIGKKILVTGNGKCNLTNEKQSNDCYRSEHSDFVEKIFAQYSYEDTREFFRQLGIMTRSKNGYIYPYNEQAASVREAFEQKINSIPNLTVKTDSHVDRIDIGKKGFVVKVGKDSYRSSQLILTSGGLAGPKTGCDGSGYQYARNFGHTIVPVYPALTPLKSAAPFLKKASGVRNQAKISLLIDGERISSEQGELQWTDYGISGVAVFQLSRYAVIALEDGKKVSLSIDFLPEQEEEDLLAMLGKMLEDCPYKSMKEIMAGILPNKLVPILLREARMEEEKNAALINAAELAAICKVMKGFTLRINGYVGFEKAQVTRGGVSFAELTESLESIYQKGLYFAGEILDVDGTCGGYNLQWAFSSGNVAGMAAGRRYLERKRGS